MNTERLREISVGIDPAKEGDDMTSVGLLDLDGPGWEPYGPNGMIKRTGENFFIFMWPDPEAEKAMFLEELMSMPPFEGHVSNHDIKCEIGQIEHLRIITDPKVSNQSKRRKTYGATVETYRGRGK